MLLGGRFVQGLGIGMYSMNVPVYQSELSPPHLRGRFVSLQQFSIVTGYVVIRHKQTGSEQNSNFCIFFIFVFIFT